MVKKSINLFLVLFLIIMPTTAFAEDFNSFDDFELFPNNLDVLATKVPTDAEAYGSMMALQSQYPEGMHWTNDDYYTSKAGGFTIYSGYGCQAFALILSDAAFGDLPITAHNDQSRIRVGDILRVNNNTHSVIVLEVRPDELTVAEGNYNSSIHWGRKLSRSDLVTDTIFTRYPEGSQPTQTEPTPTPTPQAPASNNSGNVAIYRLYSPATQEHLFTSDANEVDTLTKYFDWKNENVGWNAPATGEGVYRLFNADLNDHIYTTDTNEVNTLTSSHGWTVDNDGQPLFYSGGDVGIYRLYNSGNGHHHLTKDNNECVTLINRGWSPEGVKLSAVS